MTTHPDWPDSDVINGGPLSWPKVTGLALLATSWFLVGWIFIADVVMHSP